MRERKTQARIGNTLAKNGFAIPDPFSDSYQFARKTFQIPITKFFAFAPLPHPLLQVVFGHLICCFTFYARFVCSSHQLVNVFLNRYHFR